MHDFRVSHTVYRCEVLERNSADVSEQRSADGRGFDAILLLK
jgi:hypothetical protein